MKNLQITSAFQQVFFTVLCLTLLSGCTSVILAGQEHLSERQERVFESATNHWHMGMGAIFGLLGSKASSLLSKAEND